MCTLKTYLFFLRQIFFYFGLVLIDSIFSIYGLYLCRDSPQAVRTVYKIACCCILTYFPRIFKSCHMSYYLNQFVLFWWGRVWKQTFFIEGFTSSIVQLHHFPASGLCPLDSEGAIQKGQKKHWQIVLAIWWRDVSRRIVGWAEWVFCTDLADAGFHMKNLPTKLHLLYIFSMSLKNLGVSRECYWCMERQPLAGIWWWSFQMKGEATL